MKRLILSAIALFVAFAAQAATTVPPPLINPAGSTAGQAIVSTGASSAPAWGAVPLTGITGTLAIGNGGTGATSASAARTNLGAAATSGTLAQFAATTSAQLAGIVSDETGSGSLVFGTNPTISGATLSGVTVSGTINGVTGRWIGRQAFTSTGTYTPDTGTNRVVVTVLSGGGAGGGTPATTTGQSATGGGGFSGSYAQALFTSGYSGVTVTVPTAATGVSNAAGNAGGTASFGSLISCAGGTGGVLGGVTTGVGGTGFGGAQAACTVSGAAATYFNLPGGAPAFGVVLAAASIGFSGQGAASPFGAGGASRGSSGSGFPATAYGVGGGGANAVGAQSAFAGGTAGSPIILIDEYQ
jgi:hypothetical protein